MRSRATSPARSNSSHANRREHDAAHPRPASVGARFGRAAPWCGRARGQGEEGGPPVGQRSGAPPAALLALQGMVPRGLLRRLGLRHPHRGGGVGQGGPAPEHRAPEPPAPNDGCVLQADRLRPGAQPAVPALQEHQLQAGRLRTRRRLALLQGRRRPAVPGQRDYDAARRRAAGRRGARAELPSLQPHDAAERQLGFRGLRRDAGARASPARLRPRLPHSPLAAAPQDALRDLSESFDIMLSHDVHGHLKMVGQEVRRTPPSGAAARITSHRPPVLRRPSTAASSRRTCGRSSPTGATRRCSSSTRAPRGRRIPTSPSSPTSSSSRAVRVGWGEGVGGEGRGVAGRRGRARRAGDDEPHTAFAA